MIYKAFEYTADTAEIENILKFDQVTPILASAATGVFYKSTGTSLLKLLLIHCLSPGYSPERLCAVCLMQLDPRPWCSQARSALV